MLGEVVAIINMTALLILAVLFVLPSIIDTIIRYKKVREKVTFKKIVTVNIVTLLCVVIIFSLAGIFITKYEINTSQKLYESEGTSVGFIGEVNQITKTQYGYNIILKGDFDGTENVKALVEVKDTNANIGNTLKIYGVTTAFGEARNYGNFDQRNYYKTLGIYLKIKANRSEIINDSTNYKENLRKIKLSLSNKIDELCNSSKKGINKICDDKCGGIIKGIILGEKQDINADTKDLYQLNGISHILAISGLHISFIGMAVYELLRKRFKFFISASASIFVVTMFAVMAGFGLSTMRAVLMFAVKMLGEIFGRTYDAITSMSMACIIILISNPFALFNSGFQMSFLAIYGAGVVSPAIIDFLVVKGKVVKALIFSSCISFMLNPVIAWNYYQIPLYSVLINLIVVPLMTLVLASSLVGVMFGYVSVSFGKIFLLPACGILKLYEMICSGVERVPFYNIIVGKPYIQMIILYYGVLVIGILIIYRWIKLERLKLQNEVISKNGKIIESGKEKRAKKRKVTLKKLSLCFGMLSFATTLLFIKFYNDFQTTFIDVGQGDGIFIRTEDVTITIDGGSTTVKDVGKYRILPFLKANAVRSIDYAIVSHLDDDHISGLKEIIEQSGNGGVVVKNLVLPKTNLVDEVYVEMTELAKKSGVKLCLIEKGNTMEFGELFIECMHPGDSFVTDIRNEYSTVLKVNYCDFKMLLTGDVGTVTEPEFLKNLDRNITLLKVPHHGSKYSTSSEMLDLLKPQISVISCGQDNSYGHPHMELVKRLEDVNSCVYRTDEIGGIDVRIKGTKLEIR